MKARLIALTGTQAASTLAKHPYDLRHACVSIWLKQAPNPNTSPNGRQALVAFASCNLRHDFDQVAVWIAQQGIPVVITGVVRRLKHRYPGGRELIAGSVDVDGPHDQDHGRAARRGLD